MWYHPKYYKELRKRNKSDQAISPEAATAAVGVRPGPGLKLKLGRTLLLTQRVGRLQSPKLQAPSSKPQANQNQFRFRKRQAPSGKRPNPSSKRQASSRKLQAQRFLNLGTRKLKKFSWVKDRGPLP